MVVWGAASAGGAAAGAEAGVVMGATTYLASKQHPPSVDLAQPSILPSRRSCPARYSAWAWHGWRSLDAPGEASS